MTDMSLNASAKLVRSYIQDKTNIDLTHGEAREIVARARGHKNSHVASAAEKGQANEIPQRAARASEKPLPVLFYVDRNHDLATLSFDLLFLATKTTGALTIVFEDIDSTELLADLKRFAASANEGDRHVALLPACQVAIGHPTTYVVINPVADEHAVEQSLPKIFADANGSVTLDIHPHCSASVRAALKEFVGKAVAHYPQVNVVEGQATETKEALRLSSTLTEDSPTQIAVYAMVLVSDHNLKASPRRHVKLIARREGSKTIMESSHQAPS